MRISAALIWMALCGCAHSAPKASDGVERYAQQGDIVIAPESGIGPRLSGGRLVMPRYPADARARRLEASPIVAYVVDTAGTIEPGTLAFLTSQRREFNRAICDWVPLARFTPLVRGGKPQRALVVNSFDFFVSDTPLPRLQRTSDDKTFSLRFRAMQPAELYSFLEAQPHC